MQPPRILLIAAIIISALCASTCARDTADPVLVFAAASVEEPLTEVAKLYEENTGVVIDLSFGGSNALARQIAAGAPADLLFSAGLAPVALLASENLARSGDDALLGNELVVVVRPEIGELADLDALLHDDIGRLAIVDPELGPAGRYAHEALAAAGLWDALLLKTVLAQDVRAALAYVEFGSADAGIVYRTDANTSPELTVAYAIPSEMHSPISYLGVAIRDAANSEAAADFLRFLASDEASEAFRDAGFSSPR